MPPSTSPSAQSSQNRQLFLLKQRILASLCKLSDRDTFTLATAELHSLLSQSLDATSLPTFLSCLTSTLSSSSSPSARKHILSLISTLANAHSHALSSHVPSLVPSLTRLLRDPDSSVRAALASAVSSLPVFPHQHFDLLFRSFSESLFTEQDAQARVSAGTCLASVIENASASCGNSGRDGVERVGRIAVKCERVMRSKGWKGKVGAMRVVESVIGMVTGKELKGLVGSVLGCLGSEDWGERKAATEVLLRFAAAEGAGEFKKGCLEVLEKRRFDKVRMGSVCFNSVRFDLLCLRKDCVDLLGLIGTFGSHHLVWVGLES